MLVVSHTTPAMQRLLGLLFGMCLAELALAAFSCYRATPNIDIKPPFINSKLQLDELDVCLDTTAGVFFINSSTHFGDANGNSLKPLPPAQLYGNLSFTQQAYMQFAYPSSSSLYCFQASSAPDLCPGLQTYTDGPFVFSASPSLATPTVLTIQANTEGFIDPITGTPYNFFYAPQPIALTCSTPPCASLANVVPALPMPSNASFNVRRFLLRC